jgi:FAD:protein FMN transferase
MPVRRFARSGRAARAEARVRATRAATTVAVVLLAACRASSARHEASDAPGAGAPGATAPSGAAAAAPPSLPGLSSAPLAASGAAAERQLFELERRCMGTRCTIAALHTDRGQVEQAFNRAVAEIDRLDAMMTTWTATSEVSRINAAAGNGQVVAVSPETYDVLDRSKWIGDASGGAFDITIGVFKGLWKFDEDNDGSLPRRADVRARLPLVNYRDLILDPSFHTARLARAGQSINLGGIAKGLIVDRAVAKLRDSGLTDFLVQAGGDLYAAGRHGDRPWIVGIQDPRAGGGKARSADTSFALISLENSAFNTSGDYERFVIKDGKRYHHILDPRTGYPVTHTRSVTVLASTSFVADTLDTAVFVMGAEKGMQLIRSLPGVEAVIVDARNQLHVSPGLEGRLQIQHPPTDAL